MLCVIQYVMILLIMPAVCTAEWRERVDAMQSKNEP